MSLEKALWWLTRHSTDPETGYITDDDMARAFVELYDGLISKVETIPKGEKGDKGDPGPQGPQGDQGIQGPIGNTGPQGNSSFVGVDPVNVVGTNNPAPDFSLNLVPTPQGLTNLRLEVPDLITDYLHLSQAGTVQEVQGPVRFMQDVDIDGVLSVGGQSLLSAVDMTVTTSSGPTPGATFLAGPVGALDIVFPEVSEKYTATVAGGSVVQIAHNLNSLDVLVSVRDTGTTEMVSTRIAVLDPNQITVDLTNDTGSFAVTVRN